MRASRDLVHVYGMHAYGIAFYGTYVGETCTPPTMTWTSNFSTDDHQFVEHSGVYQRKNRGKFPLSYQNHLW